MPWRDKFNKTTGNAAWRNRSATKAGGRPKGSSGTVPGQNYLQSDASGDYIQANPAGDYIKTN